jgi:hypothetical protein
MWKGLGAFAAFGVLLVAPVPTDAQQDPPTSPAASTAKEPACDALCELGRALNQKDTPIQSQSGTGRGVVTKVPVDKQLDFRPADSNFNSRVESK